MININFIFQTNYSEQLWLTILILLNDRTVLEGQFATPFDVPLGKLDVQPLGHHLGLDPELVIVLALGPELLQERLGLVELSPEREGDDQVELENGPSRGHRADIFLARIVSACFSGFRERIVLDVSRVQVVGGFGDPAELDQGLGCVQVSQRVEATRLKQIKDRSV